MEVKVHMLAFEDKPVVRMVTIPKESGSDEAILDAVFYWGQNDFAVGPEKNTTCSVSAGDVIELDDRRLYMVQMAGFKEITVTELISYVLMDRRERQFCELVR